MLTLDWKESKLNSFDGTYYTVTNKPNFINFAADVKMKQTDRQPNKTSLYMSMS